MSKGKLVLILIDWLSALLAWFIFFTYRKYLETPEISWKDHLSDDRLVEGLIIIPLVWLCIWWLIGSYRDVYFQSRIQMIYKTIIGCLIGSLGLLFTTMRDDFTLTIVPYAELFFVVGMIHLFVFGLVRIVVISVLKALAASGTIKLLGVIASDSTSPSLISHGLLSHISSKDLDNVVKTSDAHALLIDVEDKAALERKIPMIIGHAARRHLMISPKSFAHLSDGYTGVPSISNDLIALRTSPLHPWQENLKRIIDIIGALLILILGSPIMLLLAIGVKRSSSGDIVYRQERIGRFGKTFQIMKFRSMMEDAESSGPQLATDQDSRVTSFGRWMRRWRFDELPQCINVLRGDMSLVGPRPERPYFAKQLIDIQPKYALIYQVRPGITSWGQIKYGYASSIDEMLQRFRYDLLYMEHMSLVLDIKILLYTVAVLFKGQGK